MVERRIVEFISHYYNKININKKGDHIGHLFLIKKNKKYLVMSNKLPIFVIQN